MHTYDSDDSDNFICDGCDIEIRGTIFSTRGHELPRNVARSRNQHYCEDCVKDLEAYS